MNILLAFEENITFAPILGGKETLAAFYVHGPLTKNTLSTHHACRGGACHLGGLTQILAFVPIKAWVLFPFRLKLLPFVLLAVLDNGPHVQLDHLFKLC